MKIAAVGAVCAFMLLSACSKDRLSTTALDGCPAVRIADKPHPAGEGVVTKLLSQNEAMALLSQTQAAVGRPIDGAYVNNIRAVIRADDGTLKTIIIPYSMTVSIGDQVSFQSPYLSPRPLCSYVPNLAVRKTSPVDNASSNIVRQDSNSGSITVAEIYQCLDVSTLNPVLIPRRPMLGKYLTDFGFTKVDFATERFVAKTETGVFVYEVELLNNRSDAYAMCVSYWLTAYPRYLVRLPQKIIRKNGNYFENGDGIDSARCTKNYPPLSMPVVPRIMQVAPRR
jgi:hypothetical protein